MHPITTIDEFVVNMFAGQERFSNLIYAVSQAQALRKDNKMKTFKFRFIYPYPTPTSFVVIGGGELLELNAIAERVPDEILFDNLLKSEGNTELALRHIATLILKHKHAFLRLYRAICVARRNREVGQRACYVFRNPFKGFPALTLNENCKVYDALCLISQDKCNVPVRDFFNLAFYDT